MIWETWVEVIGSSMGISDVVLAGTLISLVFMSCFVFLSLLFTGRGGVGSLFVGLFSSLFFTTIGWLPSFVMVLIVLLVAGLYAKQILRIFGSG